MKWIVIISRYLDWVGYSAKLCSAHGTFVAYLQNLASGMQPGNQIFSPMYRSIGTETMISCSVYVDELRFVRYAGDLGSAHSWKAFEKSWSAFVNT